MRIASQGFKFIAAGAVAAAAGLLIHQALDLRWLGIVVFAAGMLFTAFCIYFFRDPERLLPQNPSWIYSPGDGTVLSVSPESPDNSVRIRIFLSIFNVHIQRSPCTGRVQAVDYRPGSFLAAMKDGAKNNERCALTLAPENNRGKIVSEQIAGLVARRIECWPKPGQTLRAGERYGIIYFGSQAAVTLPHGASALVKPGDKVKAGITPIAEWIK
ncbi:MAG: phosphatidylserine decarboxylase [Elusimicrobiota bacterium]